MFVKICGLRSADEMRIAGRYADALGVVVLSGSRRDIDLERAKDLVSSSRIPIFLVSSSSRLKDWQISIEKTGVRYIQIHGNLSTEEVEFLREEYSVTPIMTFRVPFKSKDPEADSERILELVSLYGGGPVILDTGNGTGITHDHRVSRLVSYHHPIILAGGLTPENVRAIANYVKPWGVDVSGGVEKNGRKSEDLIKSFVEAARI